MKNIKLSAYPLVNVDPYLNIWSCKDVLTDEFTAHWTNIRHSICGAVVIDNNIYRFMGKIHNNGVCLYEPRTVEQKSVDVTPTQTIYKFGNELFDLEVRFISPLLPDDLMLLSRPVSYISYEIKALDNKEHRIEIFFGASSELSVDNIEQNISAEIYKNGMRCGRGNEGVLSATGDDKRIDWGWLHLFSNNFKPFILSQSEIEIYFSKDRKIDYVPTQEKIETSFPVRDKFYSLCLIKKIVGSCDADFVCIGYDDINSIEYFGKKINAYYKRDGESFEQVCKKALNEFEIIKERCDKFDAELTKEASNVSVDYAKLLCASYRQVIAAHKLTYSDEEIQFFSKECSSNGCIATVDVAYPSFPLFLRYNPDLAEGMLNPIFKYVSEKWDLPFAPHDLGQYPIANGQVYGLDSKTGIISSDCQMPVEECGNMLICVDTLCRARKDWSYFKKHIEVLGRWAKYLVEYGFDPENQLCTDDFAGHLAHNCNLSVKAIIGVACFGDLLNRSGVGDGNEYLEIARKAAAEWKVRAFENDHYSLAFGAESTWSLKYNLVWDRLLKLDIFDKDVFSTEVKYYKTRFNEYGVPQDSRSDFTKSDWQMWTAWLTDDNEYREAIINSMLKFLEDTPDRVAFSDWYHTEKPYFCSFKNRTVQGALFIGLIENIME